jgi:hypothetical protein
MENRTRTAVSPGDVTNLTRAILASRFPDDTQSARFNQLAFMHFLTAESMRGNQPTLGTLAATADAEIAEMERLAKILSSRGVIDKIVAPDVNDGARAAVAYSVSDDPVDALQKAHIAQTGAGIAL